MQPDFLIEDQGDGWWHCPSPLECFIIGGPSEVPDAGGEFWLVGTAPAIEWHGDPALEARWGPDHPVTRSFEPTSFALVMAVSGHPFDYSVPVYPVAGVAHTVSEAQWMCGHGAKVTVIWSA